MKSQNLSSSFLSASALPSSAVVMVKVRNRNLPKPNRTTKTMNNGKTYGTFHFLPSIRLQILLIGLIWIDLISLPSEACWCNNKVKSNGYFCGQHLDRCAANILYECDRFGREPIQVEDCRQTGCYSTNDGEASCWRKLSTTIEVN